MRFRDRRDAGRQLAVALLEYADRPTVLVLGLPRGGVVVAVEVANALRAPLDVWVVRKLGVPGHPELAMGAIAGAGVEVRHEDLIAELGLSRAAVDAVAARERVELERRERMYRGDRPAPVLHERDVILVDDGLATGATMEAAVEAAAQLEPRSVVVAVPVGASDAVARLRRLATRVVCLAAPAAFHAVGEWYADFSQTTDDEVTAALRADHS
jgi:predicted phosphoribosyltransferase